MKEASSESPDIDGSRSGAIPTAPGFVPPASNAALIDSTTSSITQNHNYQQNGIIGNDPDGFSETAEKTAGSNAFKSLSSSHLPPTPPAKAEGQGSLVDLPSNNDESAKTTTTETNKTSIFMDEFRRSFKLIITHSWLNVLLIFVPVGIAVAQVPDMNAGIIFGMNCIAVMPLAGLLAFATESVASNMGDALGALLNVTFGNANEIRIVQASLLGSILANLLLILGMGFFLGGLRYREQIYNSTITQMSACLLSLSVISLVLPTAFHASFKDSDRADKESLKISRGTSVILLLVYIIYLLFQLKSHAYMYESTPQHIVDAESTPGPAAAWLDSSSSDDSSSSSSSDSSDSDHSRNTMRKKMKKVLRSRRRKSSVASTDSSEIRANRAGSFNASEAISEASSSCARIHAGGFPSITGSEEAIDDDEPRRYRKRHRHRRRKYRKEKKQDLSGGNEYGVQALSKEALARATRAAGDGEPRRVDFAVQNDLENQHGTDTEPASGSKRPFMLRGVSVKNLAPSVFVQDTEPTPVPSGPVPRVRYGIRRTNSLPDRLNQQIQLRPPGALFPAQVPLTALSTGVDPKLKEKDEEHLSKIASIILLLISTGLVAVCAEFLVGSIEKVVKTSSVGEIFIGLIILPIVGNAAEHVTAITVAMKNKMDLAIGVAVGSSIQIAIFVTPLVVILGWIMDREMTLYFTLFETVCLFVSAFIVNFLVLDGRSNYLEGALLCAVYLIISVVAFFYPDENDASSLGG
ncbi:Sodium/calcium exchanger protein-domain-containing protein [Mariannaea sp. PMI_226]|nr:Sodium/calcium exchanger protein-domain-containing protein [Mariannaea sp. PMI_226]